ncbi:MAG: transporter substrate-binding domain-containing protein [Tropicimonas sp.]|uniref:transporter substrate-binding domain-containing protein n=1 Tax=Tropicimonas sp. TaxID=2067044 RepID=UPI003A89C0F6
MTTGYPRHRLLSGVALAAMMVAGAAGAQDLELNSAGKLTDATALAPGLIQVENGEIDGIMGNIFKEIASRLGLEPQMDVYDFPALIPVLQSERADMIGPALSITQPRAQVFYFAPPVLIQPETIAIREGTTIESWEQAQADGLVLSSLTGFFQIGLWESMGIEVHAFDNVGGCMLDVAKGGSDGCDVGAFDLAFFQLNNPDSEATGLQIVSVSGPTITTDMNSFGVSKSRPDLARAVHKTVREMWRDGTVERIWSDGIGAERFETFISAPLGQAMYLPGPWEDNVVPPAGEIAAATTIAEGVLTIGHTGEALPAAELAIAEAVAARLGLTVSAVKVDDIAAALADGSIDIAGGGLVHDLGQSHSLWYSLPFGFNPDYIYVRPNEDGGYPGYEKWEDVVAAGLKLAVVAGNPRAADIGADNVTEAESAAAALALVVSGEAGGFVGSTAEYAGAIAAAPELAEANLSWVRNNNNHVVGEAYGWALAWGNAGLIEPLDEAITAAWQQGDMAKAYRASYPGANISVFLAPGPTAIGTSFGASKDFRMSGMFYAGPWAQRPGWQAK